MGTARFSDDFKRDAVAQITERVADRPVERKQLEYPETYPGDEPQRRCPDISKAKAHLGYVPPVDLETGLTRFFSWTNDTYTGVQTA